MADGACGMQPEHIVKGYCPRLPGERLPASYINHYVANGGVVVPQFGGYSEELDSIAIKILQKAYGPDRKVVGVHSREVLLNAGNVHCITQQNPAPISDAKPAFKQSVDKPMPSGGGFFDSSVGSQFANRSESPKKAAPKQAAPTASASGKLPALLLPHSQNVKGNALCSCTAKRAHLVLLVIVPARMSACSLSYNHPSIKVH